MIRFLYAKFFAEDCKSSLFGAVKRLIVTDDMHPLDRGHFENWSVARKSADNQDKLERDVWLSARLCISHHWTESSTAVDDGIEIVGLNLLPS